MSSDIIVSQTSKPYISVKQGDIQTLVSLKELSSKPDEVTARLRQLGILNYSGQNIKNLRQKVDKALGFEQTCVIEHVGWLGTDSFCHADGTIITRSGAEVPLSAVRKRLERPSRGGTFECWLKDVAQPLAGQALPIMALSAGLLPLLRPFTSMPINLGWQIVGRPGSGKTSLLQLVQSIFDSPSRINGLSAIPPLTALAGGNCELVDGYFDHLLPLDDLSLFEAGYTNAARQKRILQLAENLINGCTDGGSGFGHRYAFLLSGNEALQDIVALPSTLIDRIPFVPILETNLHGIFDNIPDGEESGSHFADRLTAAANRNFGHLSRALVEKLLQEEPSEVTNRIAKSCALFKSKSNVDLNDGAAVRECGVFGLIYAAGSLAKHYELLPPSWKIGSAVLKCYKRYRRAIQPPPPFADRLCAMFENSQFLNIPQDGIKLSEKKSRRRKAEQEIAGALGFKKSNGEQIEIWVRPAAAERVLPGWSIDKKNPEVRKLMVAEGNRLTTKRKVTKKGKQERFLVFRLDKAP